MQIFPITGLPYDVDGKLLELSRGHTYTLAPDSGAGALTPLLNRTEHAVLGRLYNEVIGGERVAIDWHLPSYLEDASGNRIACSFDTASVYSREMGVHLNPNARTIADSRGTCGITLDIGITVTIPPDAPPGGYGGLIYVSISYIGNLKGMPLRRTQGGDLVFEVGVTDKEALASPVLLQNYPNPFNGSTTIRYGVTQSERVTLEIFDLLGRRLTTLVDGVQTPGWHQIDWSAEEASSGVYLYRLRTPSLTQIHKLLLVR